MRCEQVRDRLMERRSPEAPELTAHLSGCAPCGRFAARLEVARRGLAAPASGQAIRPDGGFSARVLGRLPERKPEDLLGWAALRLLPAAAASALVLTGWCLFATPAPEDVWSTAQAGADEGDLVAWVLDLEPDAGEAASDTGAGESATP
jgi:hypothetical protein